VQRVHPECVAAEEFCESAVLDEMDIMAVSEDIRDIGMNLAVL
jgi:hypothetical protein